MQKPQAQDPHRPQRLECNPCPRWTPPPSPPILSLVQWPCEQGSPGRPCSGDPPCSGGGRGGMP